MNFLFSLSNHIGHSSLAMGDKEFMLRLYHIYIVPGGKEPTKT